MATVKIFVVVLTLATLVVGGRWLMSHTGPVGEWASERSEWVWNAVKEFAVNSSSKIVLTVDAERGKEMLQTNLAAFSTEGDTHEPPVIWSDPLRSLLYSVLGYDLSNPQSFLAAELGGFQQALRHRQDTLLLPDDTKPPTGSPFTHVAQVPQEPGTSDLGTSNLGTSGISGPPDVFDSGAPIGPSQPIDLSLPIDGSSALDPTVIESQSGEERVLTQGSEPGGLDGTGGSDGPAVGLDGPGVPGAPTTLEDAIDPQESGEPVEESRLVSLARVNWGTEPLVLIFHSHTSESYRTEPMDPRADASFHVTNETDTGITRVGAAIATKLQQYGIGVVHSKRIHNFPYHWEAYVNSRRTVAELLERYPSVQVVLDIHRQGIPNVVWATTVGDQEAVKVEIIYTTASQMRYGDHPQWQSNRDFAHRLAETIEEMHPGLLHRVTPVTDKRYNQDLFPQMVLLEVGNYLDWEEHAIQAGVLLGDAIAGVLYDQVGAQSTNIRSEIRPELPTPSKPQPLPLSSR